MLNHEKYIIVEITDNSRGISQKVRMPYSCTWTKEYMLKKCLNVFHHMNVGADTFVILKNLAFYQLISIGKS